MTRFLPTVSTALTLPVSERVPMLHAIREYSTSMDNATHPCIARLNGYLSKINAVESEMCSCKTGAATVHHLLFYCPLWEAWKPNKEAVWTTINYAISTGRLDSRQDGRRRRNLKVRRIGWGSRFRSQRKCLSITYGYIDRITFLNPP